MIQTDLLRQRLANQQLARTQFTDPAAVVAWLGAVQAQDYAGAKWALAQRLKRATDATLEQAFSEGRILRTHVMRPTWHFVAPGDIRWLLALTAPRVRALMAYYDRQLKIDAGLFKRSHTVLSKVLQGREALTRAELDRALKTAGIHQTGQGLGHLVMRAELDGLICSGPRQGKQFTYMLLDERVPPAAALSRDEALAELVRRYFTSHGPALVADFVWWSGLTAADTRKGLELAGSLLARETVDGKDYWRAAGATAPATLRAAYLLPNYDEYTVAYKEREDFYDARLFPHPVTRDNVPFANMIMIRGRVAGTWKRTFMRNAVALETHWLQPPSAAEQRAVAAAARRYGEFIGLPVTLA